MADKAEIHGVVARCTSKLTLYEFLKAIGKLVSPSSVISAGKISGNNLGVFLTSAESCETVLSAQKLSICGENVPISAFVPAIKTVYIKGVPGSYSTKPIVDFLKRNGEIKSAPYRPPNPKKDIPVGFSHCISHKIVVKMVLKKGVVLRSVVDIDFGCDILGVKIEYGAKKCFTCCQSGPKNKESFPAMNSDQKTAQSPSSPAKTPHTPSSTGGTEKVSEDTDSATGEPPNTSRIEPTETPAPVNIPKVTQASMETIPFPSSPSNKQSYREVVASASLPNIDGNDVIPHIPVNITTTPQSSRDKQRKRSKSDVRSEEEEEDSNMLVSAGKSPCNDAKSLKTHDVF